MFELFFDLFLSAKTNKLFEFFLDCVSSYFKKANLVSMSKATTKNDKNVSTKIVTATFENNLGPEQVSGVTFWRSFGFFDASKSKYSMEKVNFPENTQYHLNQSYLP